MQFLFQIFTEIDSFFWSNLAFVLIIGLGTLLSWQMGFFQVLALPSLVKTFAGFFKVSTKNEKGIHPIRLFFASVGGMIGIGNIVGIVTALQIGGPGALFWIWVAAFLGSIIKYGEVFLGLKYRVPNDQGGYDGGPLYFLKAAFRNRWAPAFVAFLLCIYGVEIYQFAVLADCISLNFPLPRLPIMLFLLTLVFLSSIGGVRRLSRICSIIMPFFVLTYIGMAFYVISHNLGALPKLFATVFSSAFTGHAAVGGFVGGSVLLAIQHGLARAAYSSDIGIGYDSIIQSESSVADPKKQASLAIIGVFIDNFVCTISVLLVLISGLWTATPQIAASQLVQYSLAPYFPYMHLFMPAFLFIAGYTTIIAYFCVGLKCATFLSSQHGKKLYILYGGCAFLIFGFCDPSIPLLVMSLAGALLLITNLSGIFTLRHELQKPEFEKKRALEESFSE